MGTLSVQVVPSHPGTVVVRIWRVQEKRGAPITPAFDATMHEPFNQKFDLDPGAYAVTLSWRSGYQRLCGSERGNAILVDGVPLYYQIMGAPAEGSEISATIGATVTVA